MCSYYSLLQVQQTSHQRYSRTAGCCALPLAKHDIDPRRPSAGAKQADLRLADTGHTAMLYMCKAQHQQATVVLALNKRTCESPTRDPMYTTPLSKYEMHCAQDVRPATQGMGKTHQLAGLAVAKTQL
jgi:hypothetical protein